jgi:phosphate transport system protein
MALKVDEALQHSMHVLQTGDPEVAARMFSADDEIDAMLVSLTERCYELLSRQSPVASDLRLVVSVVRILTHLERIGDLALRIAKLAPDQHWIARSPETFEILRDMGLEATDLFRRAVRAWSLGDLRLAQSLEERDDALDQHNRRLMEAIMRLQGPDAAPVAATTLLAGRALERIADHSVMIGESLAYVLTGDVESLSKEIGP